MTDPCCRLFIGTMLNNNGPLLKNGLKNIARKQGFMVCSHCPTPRPIAVLIRLQSMVFSDELVHCPFFKFIVKYWSQVLLRVVRWK